MRDRRECWRAVSMYVCRSVVAAGMAWVFLFGWAATGRANNLAISNVILTNQDTTNDTYDIQFNISWDNSWRDAGADGTTATEDKNWDAAWVFVKYSVYNSSTNSWGDWHHASLDNTYSSVPNTCGAGSDPCAEMAFGDTGGIYKGVFIYRSSYNEGSGSNNWNVAIRWKYGDDGVADDAKVKVKVFGIEMVFIPPGPFYIGDADADQTNCFYTYGCDPASGCEYQITSENEIPVGTTTGYLYYDQDNSYAGDQSGPIPAAFPKGYNAFYIMKYEITQGQYAEFLNTISSDQAANRSGNYFDSGYGFYIKLASNGKYGCDRNDNAGNWGNADYTLMNESDDGQWIACNRLSSDDVLAYADWAALRPFTELEFEKACRGPNSVVDDEYVWGDATKNTTRYSLSNAGTASESIASNYSTTSGNVWDSETRESQFSIYPTRVGIFATSSSTRQNAGATYYGVMNMGGNLGERMVSVGSTSSRAFDGQHGDGELANEGSSNTANWPDLGSYAASMSALSPSLSSRNNMLNLLSGRDPSYGGRCARTAP